MIDRGTRLRYLGTEELTWRDLYVIVSCPKADSALARAFRGDEWPWGLSEMLQADIADSLRFLVWAKTSDARRNRNRPKQIPRPGVEGPERIGDKPVSIADMNEFLGWEVPA